MTSNPINPIPAELLWAYEDFAHRLPGVRLKTLERLSANGQFVPAIRWTPKGKLYWNARAVDELIREKMHLVSSVGGSDE